MIRKATQLDKAWSVIRHWRYFQNAISSGSCIGDGKRAHAPLPDTSHPVHATTVTIFVLSHGRFVSGQIGHDSKTHIFPNLKKPKRVPVGTPKGGDRPRADSFGRRWRKHVYSPFDISKQTHTWLGRWEYFSWDWKKRVFNGWKCERGRGDRLAFINSVQNGRKSVIRQDYTPVGISKVNIYTKRK